MLVTERFQSLASAELARAELAVPGLSAANLGCMALMATGAAEDLPQLVGAMQDACAAVLIADPDVQAWACTLVSFGRHFLELSAGGWISREALGTFGTPTVFPVVVWTAVPAVDGPEWAGFWRAVHDPIFTNLLVLDRAAPGPMPPAAAIGSAGEAISTLLEWPWAGGIAAQTRWLCEIQPYLRLLVLGVFDCQVGIQLVGPVDEMREEGSAA